MTTSEPNPEFEELLDQIKRSRGFDFTGYKRSTLTRRINKRMQALGVEGYSDYSDYLEVHPDEFVYLFNIILINVTSFFRDFSTWEFISNEIIPRIVTLQESQEPIRIWSAGCAGGQEAYTLAMVLAEALGVEQFRRVKIYATDIDDEALDQARHATYSAKEVADVPDELLDKYFEHSNNQYTFRKDLRRSVIFGRHNLVIDAPISRIDLLACRNTLMYFNAETQAKIVARFHFALNDNGFLFLGKAEMLLSHSNSFSPVDLKRRIFSKLPKASRRNQLLLMGNNGGNDEELNYLSKHMRMREATFESNSVAQVVVDINGSLALANERARILFALAPRDLGCPLQDLEMSYRPLELRSCIDQVYTEQRVVSQKDVEWTSASGDNQYFDVQIAPLCDTSNGNLLGVAISFTDVTRIKRLQQELEHSNQELEMVYEELQSTNEELEATNEELQSSNEELETTNEELQSSNEELETTNEELQSTNEELETMNEELQSSNEELQTLNEELRLRTSELNSVNSFLASILTSLRGGVVVVDRDICVQVWNDKAEDLWGLRATEVQGQNFLNLDIGLPVEELQQPIRACLTTLDFSHSEQTLQAINRRGRAFDCKVTCTPLTNANKEIQGVILLMEEQEAG